LLARLRFVERSDAVATNRSTPASARILVADDDRTTRFAIATMLRQAGYAVTSAKDGVEALRHIERGNVDLAFLDIWMPGLTGLEVLARVRMGESHPKIIIMTSDGTPQSVLRAVQEQAYEYLSKPFLPKEAVEAAHRALEQNAEAPIEVISAKPHWVELLIPCTREAAERIQSFLLKLETDLPEDVRSMIGIAFRELVLNAVEWGGRLDPNRKVRIAHVRSSRMLLYRVADPGPGFSFKDLTHAAVGQKDDQPFAHVEVRDQLGLRPGGFGIAMIRAMADELLYNEAQNEVIFIKYLAPPSPLSGPEAASPRP
jgi:CheY-like chemotaxis protein/anti-sigma regulatory factor (Ser/Thr protein kinase)